MARLLQGLGWVQLTSCGGQVAVVWKLSLSFPPEFNVGQYRRNVVRTYTSFEIFRPDNEEGLKIRK